MVVTTLGGCCWPRQGRCRAPYNAPARPRRREPARPSCQWYWVEGPWSSLNQLFFQQGNRGGTVRKGFATQRDRTGPGLEHGPRVLGTQQRTRGQRRWFLAAGSLEEGGRGRGRQREAARPVGAWAWAGRQTQLSDILGKKFLGMNFIMRQQLPWVPGVGCPDTASPWGLGCTSGWGRSRHHIMASELGKLGAPEATGLPGTAQTCPVSAPARQGAPRLLTKNNGVAGALPVR